MEAFDHADALTERARNDGLRFVRRMYLPRIVGLAMGALCIGGALWQQEAPPLAWAALFLNTFAWPHLAYLLGRRAATPHRTELASLTVDSASGGAWIAAIGLSSVPSAVLFAMLAMDKASIGGLRFLGRCLLAQAAAFLAVAFFIGPEPHLASSPLELLASLPLLFGYPIVVGLTTYRLSRKVRQQNQMLAALSSTDGLSGLLNRRHWEQALSAEFQRCRRLGHPSALLLLDVDNFKAINDTHGHGAGDEAIRAVADLLRDRLRHHDVPCRYGGEEFAALLPGANLMAARITAERVRKAVEEAVLDPKSGVRATVSIGVAAIDARDEGYGDAVARADRALYRAKQGGRNRSEVGDWMAS